MHLTQNSILDERKHDVTTTGEQQGKQVLRQSRISTGKQEKSVLLTTSWELAPSPAGITPADGPDLLHGSSSL